MAAPMVKTKTPGTLKQGREATRYPGVRRVHVRGCRWQSGRCTCKGRLRYEADVWSARERKRIRKHFSTEGAARTWREDAGGAIRKGTMRAPTATTVDQAADKLLAGMADGSILDRSGAPYKPSTTRSYETSLRLRIRHELGHRRLSTLERREVQALIEKWRGEGLEPSTVVNTLNPVQVLCRRAVRDGELAIDPTEGLELPAVRGRRDRAASPREAVALLAALQPAERALWGAAFYSGLRRGELRGLRWSDVDFDAGVIRVRRSWDQEVGVIDVKTASGRRGVPILGALRKLLAAHKLATGRDGDDLVFGRTATEPFIPSTVRKRALKAWERENARRVKDAEDGEAELLDPIGLHEARHSFASFAHGAKLDLKDVSVYMGHSDVRTTLNIYTHLLDGHEARSAARLDDYMDAAQA